uniref:Uncharacterized protein n=1 Tax=Saccharomyces pastorianus TaxID=27292 RepID=P78996_SACPS|nr:unknown [Saccharomyces pastorianus]
MMDETALLAFHEGVSKVGNGGLAACLCICLYANAEVDDELQRTIVAHDEAATLRWPLCNNDLNIRRQMVSSDVSKALYVQTTYVTYTLLPRWSWAKSFKNIFCFRC